VLSQVSKSRPGAPIVGTTTSGQRTKSRALSKPGFC
jgi:hypothetical protein